MTDLELLFTRASQASDQAIEKIQLYDHPLLTLLKETLQKQQEALLSLLYVLRQKEDHPPIESFKNDCSIAYHANEMANSFFQSWTRAVDWMKLPSKAIVPDVKIAMDQMKNSFDEAANEMESVYGFAKVKYVISTFYLPA